MSEVRYNYVFCSTRAKAEEALADGYASGAIDECEEPRIEYKGGNYYLTLRDNALSY